MKERKAYKVDELQEIYAMSVTHIFTGFFPSFPTTNGLGRAMVIDACGATSQVIFLNIKILFYRSAQLFRVRSYY
jgi:MFS superfamily sulfate permease-like transporter